MELLSCGRMAELTGVSAKALHLYQEKGILVPSHVSPDTGYRYYDVGQCLAVDSIAQLQAVGFSLDEIAVLTSKADIGLLHDELIGKLAVLEDEERRLNLRKKLARGLVSSCNAILNPPIFNQIMLELIPTRHALVFDVPECGPDDKYNRSWEAIIMDVRNQMRMRGCPHELFGFVSGIIAREDLMNRSFVTHRAAIFVDGPLNGEYGPELEFPAGQHMVMFCPSALLEDGSSSEYPAIERMLEHAERRGFEVCGDYVGETIANTPAFSYKGGDAYFKMSLPVRRPRQIG